MKRKTARALPHVWTRKELARLGKVSDAELAREIGLLPQIVSSKRRIMNIAGLNYRASMKWGRKELALLGKHPDIEVARLLKISRKMAVEKRYSLGVPSYAKNSKLWHIWTKQQIALLGTRKDVEVAKKIGISPVTVSTKRRQLNIPSILLPRRTKPTTPRPLPHVWTTHDIALLGTMTDLQVADLLNLGHRYARLKRISLGIPPFGKRAGLSIWTPKVIARLGKEPCRQIATELGVSHQRVYQKCQELGIASSNTRSHK